MLPTASDSPAVLPSRDCKYCGAVFYLTNHRQWGKLFCSVRCQQKKHARSEKAIAINRAWKKAHPEIQRAYQQARRHHFDQPPRTCDLCGESFSPGSQWKRRFCSAKCRTKNHDRSEKGIAAHRAWHKAHPECQRQYREKNRESRSEYHKIYSSKNREAILKHKSKWRKANRLVSNAITIRYRAKKKGAQGSHTAKEFVLICKKQGGKCAHCGKKRKLTVDHVIPISQGGTNFAYNIEGVCGPCNSAKGAKILEYAHPSLFDTR